MSINSMFYKIKDDSGSTRGYIFGATHLNLYRDSEYKICEKVLKCFLKSNSLSVEYNVLNHPRLDFLGKTLKERVSSVRVKHPDIMGQDAELLMQGIERDVAIFELETLEEQEKAREGYQEDYGRNTFQKLLKFPLLESQATPEELSWKKELDEVGELRTQAWKTSDEAIIEKVAKYGISEEYCRVFYDKRNEKMAVKITEILQSSGKHFITVGAGHVVGKAGIVNLLREKGWHFFKSH